MPDRRTFISSLVALGLASALPKVTFAKPPFTVEMCNCSPARQVTWAMLDKWPVVYLGCRDHIKDMVAVPIRAGVMPCTQEQFDAFVDELVLKPYKETL